MNIKKAKRLLAKINVLVDNHDDAFSTLENDLLKTYIKELYECVSGLSNPVIEDQKDLYLRNEENTPDNIIKEKPLVVAQHEEDVKNQKEPFAKSVIKEEPLQRINDKIQTEVEPELQDSIESHVSTVENIVEEVSTNANINTPPKPVTPEIPVGRQQEMEALFAVQKGGDLLSKLGSKPVTLIENAMGINERIFTINELFRSDRDLFQKTVDTINRFENYDQAKDFLMQGIAQELDWLSEGKVEKAAGFIRIVQRKFISS